MNFYKIRVKIFLEKTDINNTMKSCFGERSAMEGDSRKMKKGFFKFLSASEPWTKERDKVI